VSTASGSGRLGRAYPDSRPYVRWWWFSGTIERRTIRGDLEWIAAHGFGGVEIAWVYPQPGAEPGPRWLSAEWSSLVAFASEQAVSLGLGCDFTFGTAWPLGGSIVDESMASRTLDGLSPQRVEKSWELAHGVRGPVLNHIDRTALARYAACMSTALKPALQPRPSAFFCDSWEVETEGLWTDGFGERFRERFGYVIDPYMPELDQHPDQRYDYRRLLAEYILDEHYRPCAEHCHTAGGLARVQAHGAPTDLLAAYATADVPESETLLFEPPFSSLAASAATLAGRPLVSAEAFTCLYGWEPYPGSGPHLGEERAEDLRLLADALFAHGVNFIVWHGMPLSEPGRRNRFYATTHVGPDCGFADELAAINAYLTQVSGLMRQGRPLTQVAVYLPLEDAWMRGELPEDERVPGARYHGELRSAHYPPGLDGFACCWVSARWLREARGVNGKLVCGTATFELLYVDVDWLDSEALADIARLAREQAHVCLCRRPRQPGARKAPSYGSILEGLTSAGTVKSDVGALVKPVVRGSPLPQHCCRVVGGCLRVFFANPATRDIRYPLRYGQGRAQETVTTPVEIDWNGKTARADLVFEPGQSLLVDIDPAGTLTRHGTALELVTAH